MRTAIVGLLFLLAAPAVAQARIGDVPVTLGENADEALSRLRERYETEQVPSIPGAWRFFGSDGDPIGSVGVRDGRVAVIERTWPMEAADEVVSAALTQVVGALAQLERYSESGCSVRASGDREPGIATERVEVRCGTHLVSIVAGTVGNISTAAVYEIWTEY